MGEPVGKRHVLVGIGFKDLQENQIRITNVLDVVTKVRLDVADVAGG
jgi:hypothetical protein